MTLKQKHSLLYFCLISCLLYCTKNTIPDAQSETKVSVWTAPTRVIKKIETEASQLNPSISKPALRKINPSLEQLTILLREQFNFEKSIASQNRKYQSITSPNIFDGKLIYTNQVSRSQLFSVKDHQNKKWLLAFSTPGDKNIPEKKDEGSWAHIVRRHYMGWSESYEKKPTLFPKFVDGPCLQQALELAYTQGRIFHFKDQANGEIIEDTVNIVANLKFIRDPPSIGEKPYSSLHVLGIQPSEFIATSLNNKAMSLAIVRTFYPLNKENYHYQNTKFTNLKPIEITCTGK